MRFVERKVLEVLLAEAAKEGYYPEVIGAFGCDGEDGATISQDRMQTRVIIEHVNAWDADSVLTFRHVDEDSTFWVHLVWGNGVDVIHDYCVHPDADRIILAVNKEVEA